MIEKLFGGRLAAPVACLLTAIVASFCGGSVFAQQATPTGPATTRSVATRAILAKLPVVRPRVECSALKAADVSRVVGAQTTVTAAIRETSVTGYEVCDVTGVIAPQIRFEIQLPIDTYRQRYLQLGCGGLCGTLALKTSGADGCMLVANGAFVMASSNQGHIASRTDSGHFGTDPQLRADFAYRSDHVLALAAKALIERFYGQRPKFAYFDGCSQGGHQALTEAQRFPDDFDGILAGAPALITQALNTFYQPWLATINLDTDGHPILLAAKLPMLHAAVMHECDGKDGLVDGQIDDPRACKFDPASLACPEVGEARDCLAPAEIEVVRKAYSGPVTAEGEHLYPGGLQYGSELAWSPWFVPASAQAPKSASIAWNIGNAWVKYLAFDPESARPQGLDGLQFTRETFQRAEQLAKFYDATSPDLATFRDAGGKLILYHGWADQAIPPTGTIAYYQAMQAAMGGPAATREFARLFMIPGMFHCSGGDAPDSFDLLTRLMTWVETGTAPAKVIASKREKDQIVRTRPVFPYPLAAQYDGSGSVDDAVNFAAAPPHRLHEDRVTWLGSFSQGGELWFDPGTKRLVDESP